MRPFAMAVFAAVSLSPMSPTTLLALGPGESMSKKFNGFPLQIEVPAGDGITGGEMIFHTPDGVKRLERGGSVVEVFVTDLGTDGDDEVVVWNSCGNGSYAEIILVETSADGHMRVRALPEISQGDLSKADRDRGLSFMGKQTIAIVAGTITTTFPLYREDDPMANPTGGKREFYYNTAAKRWLEVHRVSVELELREREGKGERVFDFPLMVLQLDRASVVPNRYQPAIAALHHKHSQPGGGIGKSPFPGGGSREISTGVSVQLEVLRTRAEGLAISGKVTLRAPAGESPLNARSALSSSGLPAPGGESGGGKVVTCIRSLEYYFSIVATPHERVSVPLTLGENALALTIRARPVDED